MMEYMDADYYQAQNRILGVDASAYVEGLDDIFFWKEVFRKYAPHIKITFYPYSREGKLKNGKYFVLSDTHLKNMGKHLILCVDSDYDYLIDSSKFSSPFVFHTYTHSIENYKLSPNGLDSLLQKCVYLDSYEIEFSFKKFMNKYSESIYPVFLYILFFEHNGEENSEKLLFNKSLSKEIGLTSNIIKEIPNFSNTFTILNKKVSLLTDKIKENHPSINLADVKETLKTLNISESEIFWYIRGHLLYDNVIKIILPKLISYYKSKKIHWFDTHQDTSQRNNKKQEYIRKVKGIDYKTLLSNNHTECLIFDSCPPLKNIEQDIKNYLMESS